MVSALTSVADARAVGLCALALTRKERENAGLCVGASDVRVLVGGVKRGIACEETDRTRDTRETATGARVGAIPAASARGDIVGSGDMHEVSRVRDARSGARMGTFPKCRQRGNARLNSKTESAPWQRRNLSLVIHELNTKIW